MFTTRVGDAERQECAAVLGEHHLQGRLGADEYESRVAEALQARTEADLVRLLTDLPSGGLHGQLTSRPRQRSVVPDLPGRFWTRVAAPVAAVGTSAYFASLAVTPEDPLVSLAACFITGAVGFVAGRLGRRS